MLAEDFDTILHNLGMAWLEHPLFHHAPVAIRFEIGGDEPVYLECTYSDENTEKLTPNPAYVQGALGAGDYDLPEPSSAAGYSAD